MSVRIDKKQLQKQFGRAAHTYNQYAQMQNDIAASLAASLSDIPLLDISENITAVDLGCGTGIGVKLLHQRYPQAALLGVDIAIEMLQVAQSSYPYAQFSEQDMENLLLSASSVNLLFSSSAIQWCDAERVLSECFRVLKPGGCLLFSTFLHGTLSGWRELWMSEQQIQRHSFLTEPAISKMLQKAGFEVLKKHQQLITQQFSSFEQATISIKALGAGNAVKSAQSGLMGKQKYFRLKAELEQQLSTEGAINLDYQAAYFVVSKGFGTV